jgi:hypothetical protein
MTAETADELARLRAERDGFRAQYLRASDDRDELNQKLTELDEMLERERDDAASAWEHCEWWCEYSEAIQAELEEERRERDALLRLEVERLTGQEPKRRGRRPTWLPESEAEVEHMHLDGASIRQIAADLGVSKTQVHRVLVRVRRRQAEALELARLTAIAEGRSPVQRRVRVMQQAAGKHRIKEYDPFRVERARARLDRA